MVKKSRAKQNHIIIFRGGMIATAAIIVIRLFILQVVDARFYESLASNQHEFFAKLVPKRGEIFMSDKNGGRFPFAANQETYLLFADIRKIKDAEADATTLSELTGIDKEKILTRLNKTGDPFEPLGSGLSSDIKKSIEEKNISGIGFLKQSKRVYPLGSLGSHLVGFLGSDEKGEFQGRYGLEAQFEQALKGTSGNFSGERDVVGRIIPIGRPKFDSAVDGDDLTLSIDRNIEYIACERLREAVKKHGADGGSVIIIDPKTGAVLALCGEPNFDPNDYAKAEINRFNNPAVWNAYEPGSVFKIITMASAIDTGSINPETTYEDKGAVTIGPHVIRNSDNKAHGVRTMSEALAQSLNTGAIFAMRATGISQFVSYVRNFGFGKPTGVELPGEASGDIKNLSQNGEIYSATASFGQGISATPMQLAAAIGAVANGGKLMKPYVVKEIRRGNEIISSFAPKMIREVISARSATLLSGMMVKVVEEGHGRRAGVPGFWVAGKTGTAQIPAPNGGYEPNSTIGTFVGFAPVEDPKFVMLTRIDRPRDVKFAESSAAPLFGEIANFLLQYLEIQPTRPIGKNTKS